MVQAPPKPGKIQPEAIPEPRMDRPWHQYRGEPNWKLLEPGWAGILDDEELVYVQDRLKADDALSYWWGFRPAQKTRHAAGIRRVARHGNPERRSDNVRLVREAGRRAFLGDEADSGNSGPNVGGGEPTARASTPDEVEPLGVLLPSGGRPRIDGMDETIQKMAGQGMGVKKIAKTFQTHGIDISHMTVARRLRELRTAAT